MALEGDAKKFALDLKEELEKIGIDIDTLNRESMDNFQKNIKEKLRAGKYDEKASKTKSKDIRAGVEESLTQIENLCNACIFYNLTVEVYNELKNMGSKEMRKWHAAQFADADDRLSDETKKLAKAIYLKLALKYLFLKNADGVVPAAVYAAANLCDEWRKSPDVAYANIIGGDGKKYEPTLLNAIINNEDITYCFYKIIPELKSVLPQKLKHLDRVSRKRRWRFLRKPREARIHYYPV